MKDCQTLRRLINNTILFFGKGVYSLSGIAISIGFVFVFIVATPLLNAQTITVTKSITSGNDDVEEEGPDGVYQGSGYMFLNSSDLEIVRDDQSPSSGTQKIGLRFNNINVPKNATIVSAYLTFKAITPDNPNTNSGAASFIIKGQAADNAPFFTSTYFNLSTRPLTTATTNWSPGPWTSNALVNSPGITSIIQEIVNRPGWISGNSMVIRISGTGSRSAVAYNGDAINAPKLTIVYSLAPPLTISSSITNVHCRGNSTGAIDITANGGTPPYTYDWSNDGAEAPDNDSQDLSNLSAGSYVVTVTDSKGITASSIFNITQPGSSVTLTGVTTNISSVGGSNGAIDLSVTGGTAPYTYDWSNDGSETPDNDAQDLNNLVAGIYSVTVTDVNGCSSETGFTLIEVINQTTVNKQLYLTDALGLDRINPASPIDNSTAYSSTLSYGGSAVVVDAVSTGSTTSTNKITVSHTTGSLSNRIMLVGVSNRDKTVTSVSYGGSALTLVGTKSNGTNCNIAIYSLMNPPAGTANVIVNLSGNATKGAVAGVITFSGVDLTNPMGPFTSASGNTNNPTVNISSAVGELVFDVIAYRNSTSTPGAGQTARWNINTGQEVKTGGASTEPGAATTTMSWNGASSSTWAIGGFTIKPAPILSTVTFTENAPLCTGLTIKSGNQISVSSYLNIVNGSMPANPSISAVLKYGATTIITLNSPTYNNATGLLTWTGTLGSDVNVPAGQSIALQITSTQTGVSFQIKYDSQLFPSKITLPVSTFINVSSVGVYNSFYPNGSPITNVPNAGTSYIRVSVSDPFGNADISKVNLVLTKPNASTINVTMGAANVVSTSSCGKIYQYNWINPTDLGSWDIKAIAYEGTEGVTHFLNIGVNVIDPVGPVTQYKQLYLSDPSQALDRIDPVAAADGTLAQTGPLSYIDTKTYIDNFNTNGSFTGNNGTNNWTTNWVEELEADGAATGDLLVTANVLSIKTNNVGDAVYRQADLLNALSASLSLNLTSNTIGSGRTDKIDLEISSNGGSNYTLLDTYTAGSLGVKTYNILAYASANTRIRLIVTEKDQNRIITFDDISISYTLSAPNTSTTFTQNPVLCSGLTIKAQNPVTISNYVSIVSGSMPASPAITALLKYGSTTIMSVANPTYNGVTGLLTWTSTLGSDVVIPAGSALELVITSAQAGVSFRIDYDSNTKPSKIDLPVNTYIDINSYNFYNAAYPGGSIITNATKGSTAYLRVAVSDPFGTSDITALNILNVHPDGTPVNTAGTSVNTTGCVRTYQYSWTSPLVAGDYDFTLTAKEGLENTVVDIEYLRFSLCPLTVSASLVNSPSCNVPDNGQIQLNIADGNGPYTYTWTSVNPGGSGNGDGDMITGLSPGTYIITVTSAGGCTDTAGITITVPTGPVLSMTSSNASCLQNDGSINLEVQTAGDYTYFWDDGTPTQDRLSEPPGLYSVTVTDNTNGCTSSLQDIEIGAGVGVGAVGTISNVSCNGGNNGFINLTPTGGSGIYTFNWSNGLTTKDLNNLSAGTYTVTLSDDAGCTGILHLEVTQPDVLTITPDIIQPTCIEGGEINLTAEGANAPYTYDWEDLPGSNNPITRKGLTAGSYNVTVSDVNGCQASTQAVLVAPVCDQDAVLACKSNPSDEFSVALDPMATSYNWTVPIGAVIVSGQGTNAIVVDWSGASAGVDQVCVSSENICGESLQECREVTIIEVAPTLTLSVPSCLGGNMYLSGSGGVSYSWTGPGGFSSTLEAPVIIDAKNINSGIYTVTVTDLNGCTGVASVTANIFVSPSASLTTTEAACRVDDGAIDLTVSGGEVPYSFTWSNGEQSEDITNLYAGNYKVTITDAHGCTKKLETNIGNTGAQIVSLTPTDVLCYGGSTGSINTSFSGGTPPFTYFWSNGSTTQNLSNIPAGSYSIKVTGADGCEGIASVDVEEPAEILTDYNKTDISCFSGNNGSIDLIVSGGTAPYTYDWSNDGPDAPDNDLQDLNNLVTDNYTVTITDANSCTQTLSLDLSQPQQSVSVSSSKINSSCSAANNGSINLTSSGGTPPYSYDWSDLGGTDNPKDRSNLAPGTYFVTVYDSKLCTASTSIIITEPSALSLTNINTNVKCFNENNGSIDINPSGGTSPYQYLWSNGATTQDISGLSANTYSVVVTDSKGCTINSSYLISEPAILTSGTVATQPSCYAGSNGSINLTVSGGTQGYSYIWSNAAITEDISGLSAGNYQVTITDVNNCKLITSAQVTNRPQLTAVASVSNNVCNNAASGSINITPSGGTGAYSYDWLDLVGTSNSEDRTGLSAGSYTVTITDANSCPASYTYSVTHPAPVLTTMQNTNAKCLGSNDGEIALTISGGQSPYSYIWSNGSTTKDLNNLSPGVYSVTVTDANNCTASSSSNPIIQPSSIGITINATSVKCFGSNDGSLTAIVTGGTSPYNYVWSNNETTQSINSLFAGNYSVTVTDGNNCSSVSSKVLNEGNQPIEIFGEITRTSCGGNNGAVNLTVNGGVEPYSYLWSNGFTGADPQNLSIGSYTVTVTDNLNCTKTASFNVSASPAFVAEIALYDRNCLGPNGSGFSSYQNGVAPYSYQWSNGATTQNIQNLDAGNYSVTITEGNGCTSSAFGTVGNLICNPPVAQNDEFYIFINSSLTQTVGPSNSLASGYDYDSEDPLSSLTFLPLENIDPTKGSISWDTTYNGGFHFTPANNFLGTITVNYQVCDLTDLCDIATLTIHVSPLNSPPVAINDTVSTNEDTPLAICVLNNDSDVDNNLNLSSEQVLTNPAHGSFSINSMTHCIQYTPTLNYNGPDQMVYKVCDSAIPSLCDTANIFITIIPQNDPPVANNDSGSTSEDTPVSFNITNNDSDLDGNIVIASIDLDLTTIGQQTNLNVPGEGSYSINLLNGEIIFTPAQHFNGPTTPINYRVCDNGTPLPALCDDAQISITVNAVNDAPVANDDSAITDEDTPVTFSLTGNDTDLDGNIDPVTLDLDPITPGKQLSYNIAGQGSYAVNLSNGEVTFTPFLNFKGTVSTIDYEVCDDGTPLPSKCDVAQINVTVSSVNDPPVATNDLAITNEDVTIEICVPFNDSDLDGNLDVTSVTIISNPSHGTVSVNPLTGCIIYAPGLNYNGPDQFTYSICDTGLPVLCDEAVVDITVNPVNDPPVANDDNASTEEETPVVICVSNNDTDLDGNLDITSVVIVTNPSHGSVTVNNSTGCITYTPETNYNGTDQFSYRICDTGLPVLCDVAVVDITISGLNDGPDAINDQASTPEDTPVVFNITANDIDLDGNIDPATIDLDPSLPGQQLSYLVAGKGNFAVNVNNGDILFSPVLNFNGPVNTVNYRVCDDGTPLPSKCDVAQINLTVTPVNDPPVANNDNAFTPEDVPVQICMPANDTDLDGNLDQGSVTITANPTHGTIVLNPATGCVIYTPFTNYNGNDQFSYNICDTGLPVLCDDAIVNINIGGVNDLPNAANDLATTNEDTPILLNVLANDNFGGDGPSNSAIIISSPPAHGTVIVNDNNTPSDPTDDKITYTPNLNYNGIDQFAYLICDANSDCDIAVVDITVNPVNDPPIANDDEKTTPEETPVSICVYENDTDPDGNLDNNSIIVTINPQHGTLSINPLTKCILYTPDNNYTGTDQFTYQICDTGLPVLCDKAIVDITISGLNDAPVANDDSATTPEDTPVTFNLITNDTDTDGSIMPGTIDLEPSNPGQQLSTIVPGKGSFNINTSNGNVTFIPVANFNGLVNEVSYQVCDNGTPLPAKCDIAQISVTVTPGNDLPVATDDIVNLAEDTPVLINILVNDNFGGDGPSGSSIQIVSDPGHGIASVNDNGTPSNPTDDKINYISDLNYTGADQFSYQICDLNGDCDIAVVYLSISSSNDPPIANDDIIITDEDTPGSVCLLDNDVDSDGNLNIASLMILSNPVHGTISLNPQTGCVIYTPALNYNGPDQFKYKVCDTGSPVYCDDAFVNITVVPVNDPPVAIDDNIQTQENVPVVFNITQNDSDVDGSINPATIDLNPSLPGQQTIYDIPGQGSCSVTLSTGNVTFQPELNFNGDVDIIDYKVCDSGTPLPSLCATAHIKVVVIPVNEPPVANDDYSTTIQDIPTFICLPDNDTDADFNLDISSVNITNYPANGYLTLDQFNGCIIYSPFPGFHGPDHFTYQICDTGIPVSCDDAMVHITVLEILDLQHTNVPPDANDDQAVTNEDTPVSFSLVNNDTDVDGNIDPETLDLNPYVAGQQTTLSIPGQGTYNLNLIAGTVQFIPAPNFNGQVNTIYYRVCDDGTPLPSQCDIAQIDVTVIPANDPPIANNDLKYTLEDTPVVICVQDNDIDPEGALNYNSVMVTMYPSHGTITFSPGNNCPIYIPNPNYNGTDQFTYKICDSGNPILCDDAIVNITIGGVNDLPDAVNDTVGVPEETVAIINVLDNDSFGGDGPSTSEINVFTNPQHGIAIVLNNNTPQNPLDDKIQYTPYSNFNGTDEFAYQICDADGDCDIAVVHITILPENDPPIAVDDIILVTEDTPIEICVPDNDSDPDGNLVTNSVEIISDPGHGFSFVNTLTGCINYVPDPDYTGPDQLIYKICDDANPALCDTAIVYLTVVPDNDPPIINDDSATTPEDTPVTFNIIANDIDSDGNIDPQTIDLNPGLPGQQLTRSVAEGNFSVNILNGDVTFTPVLNFYGPVTPISYQVCDDGTPLPVRCNVANIFVTVTTGNDKPVANDDNAMAMEDMQVQICMPENDFDLDGNLDVGSVMITVNPLHGTLNLNQLTGCVIYTPDLNYNGPDEFSYKICDTGNPVLCDDAVVHINIGGTNDLPNAVNDLVTTNEDAPLLISVLNNDNFGGDGPASYAISIVSNPANGSVSVDDNTTPSDPTDDKIWYTPNANYNGNDQFTYLICDANADCDIAIVNIGILQFNDPPVALDDSISTFEETPIDLCIANNDFDADGSLDLSSIVLLSNPTNGLITLDPISGCITYTPFPGFHGIDSITYQICDTGSPALCDEAKVILEVKDISYPPVAFDDEATTLEDIPVTICVADNDFDPDGNLDLGSISIVSNPVNGTLSFNAISGCYIYTPDPDYSGPDQFVYSICDSGNPVACDQAVVSISVLSVNEPPVAIDDNITTPEDTPVNICVVNNDTDPDGNLNISSISIVNQPSNGVLIIDPVTACINYTPFPGYNGSDEFTYKICDSGSPVYCDEAKVSITISNTNNPPVAVDDITETDESSPVEICVSGNDSDPDNNLNINSISVVSNPVNGTVSINQQTGCITYTPDPGYNGPDQFTYNICDSGNPALCDQAVVYINVKAVNQPPVANDDISITPEANPVSICIASNDSDPDGNLDLSSVTIINYPVNGLIDIDPVTACITYTPFPGFNGLDEFTYSICDSGNPALCDLATVSINVTNVNQAPIANDDNANTAEDTPVLICLPDNDFDVDGNLDISSVILTANPLHGTLSLDPQSGCAIYTPFLNYNGSDQFSYTICDTGNPALCDEALVYINVGGSNDLPLAVNDNATTYEDTPMLIDVLLNDNFGGDGPSNSAISIIANPGHGSAVVNNNGTPGDPTDDSITYTPTLNYGGADQFSYQICDSNGDCDIAIVNITVTAGNDAPVANDDNTNTQENKAVSICVANNDTDPDGNLNLGSVTIISNPAHGSVSINPITGCITYLPSNGYNGSDQFTYQICDSGNPVLCDQATVQVSVSACPLIISGVPADLTLECDGKSPAVPAVTVSNCCQASLNYKEIKLAGICAGNYTLIRTWTASDQCGNSISKTQSIVIQDTKKPFLQFKDPKYAAIQSGDTIKFECGFEAAFGPKDFIYKDDCDSSPEFKMTDYVIKDDSCKKLVFCVVEVIDDSGNNSQLQFYVSIEDKQGPVISYNNPVFNGMGDGDTLKIECGQPPVFSPDDFLAIDNCDPNPVIKMTDLVIIDIPCKFLLRCVVTACDDCGNVSNLTFYIQVADEEAPVFNICPPNVTLSCNDQIPPASSVTITDNCDPVPKLTYKETKIAGNCPQAYTLIRTWTAVDNCFNMNICKQTIKVEDKTAPVITLPGYTNGQIIELECGTTIPVFTESSFKVTDDCDNNLTIKLTKVIKNGNCPVDAFVSNIIYTFTATDDCGNVSTFVIYFLIKDTTPPVLQPAPGNIILDCGDPVPPAVTLTATDNCDQNVTVTFNESSVPGSCGNTFTITRIWTATDDCGNTSSTKQIIKSLDGDPPVFGPIPADLTISCDATIPAAINPTATDKCDPQVIITYTEQTIPGSCPQSYTIVRIWTATDDCGNTATASQKITLIDTQAPLILGVPADVTMECNEPVPGPGKVKVADNCDAAPVLTMSVDTILGNCKQSYTLIRKWTATDACGNVSTKTQKIVVKDTTPPVFTSVPASVTVECNAPLPGIGNVLVVDNCDFKVDVTFKDVITPGNCVDAYTITRTFTAVDDCGNSAQATQIISVQDNTPPVLGPIPTDITIACDSPIPPAVVVTATDNCDQNVSISVKNNTSDIGCNKLITRTYIAIDNCGNSSYKVQYITTFDNTPPVIQNPPLDVNMNCGDPVPPVAVLTATDICDQDVVVTVNETTQSGNCPGNYVITRIWTATDDCGNTSTVSQTIKVTDTLAPLFANVPADLTISCDAAIPTIVTPTATDKCDPQVDITLVSSTFPGNCPQSYTIIRTWTATDDCGNSAKATQHIFVNDTKAPLILGVPLDVTIECDETIPGTGNVKAADNCDLLATISLTTQTIPGACPQSYTIIRTWTATDACGNVSTATQKVTVKDSKPPVFTQVPGNITIECSDPLPGIGNVLTVDNCDKKVDVTFQDEKIPGNCIDSYILKRTFTAADDCGNTATAVQNITVQDHTSPVIDQIPADITLECGTPVPGPSTIEAADNCDLDVQISVKDVITGTPCDKLITRVYTAQDNCGNTASKIQHIRIIDTTPPVVMPMGPLVNVADGDTLVFNCDEAVVADTNAVKFKDACDPDVPVVFIETVKIGNCIQDGFLELLTCTWSGTDDCGNKSSYTIYMKIVDTKAPVIVSCAPQLTIQCTEVIPPGNIVATDNCDNDLEITVSEVTIQGNCPQNKQIFRTFIVKDDCGNTASCVQKISVVDNKPPTIVGVPANITVECDAIPAVPDINTIKVTDLCDPAPSLVFTENIESDKCPYNITRTWIATDACGNSTSRVQIITVFDHNAPIINGVPADITVDLDNGGVVPGIPNVTVSDLCDQNPKLVFTQTTDTVKCDVFVVRTWTATDLCGNQSVKSQKLLLLKKCPCIEPVITDVKVTDAVCGKSNGQVEITIGNGAGNYEYIWLPNLGTSNATGNIRSDLPPGTYSVIVNSLKADNCYKKITINVICLSSSTQNLELLVGAQKQVCIDNSQLPGTPISISNVCGSLSGEFSTLGINNNTYCIDITGIEPGTEKACIVVCDDLGYCDTTYINIKVKLSAKPIAIDDHLTFTKGESILVKVLTNDLYGDNQAFVDIIAQPDNAYVLIDADNNVAVQPNEDCEAIKFDYELCTVYGCDTATVFINFNCSDLIFYTGVTPNNDGLNDVFKIDGLDKYPNNKLTIFNRWGNQVYYSKSYQNDWKGEWNNKILPDGTYFYFFEDGEGKTYTGYLQIQR